MFRSSVGLVLSALLSCTSAALLAQGQKVTYSATYNKCREVAQSTVDIGECFAAERARWEKRLTTAYQTLLKKYASEDKETALVEPFKPGTTRVSLLRAAERAWVAFRDAECRLVSSATSGGSLSGLNYGDCELSFVAERTLLLERLAKD